MLMNIYIRENAILVVSSSLEKAQGQLKQLSEEQGPKLRKSSKFEQTPQNSIRNRRHHFSCK